MKVSFVSPKYWAIKLPFLAVRSALQLDSQCGLPDNQALQVIKQMCNIVLSPISVKHLISSYVIITRSNIQVMKNKAYEHQKKNVMMLMESSRVGPFGRFPGS